MKLQQRRVLVMEKICFQPLEDRIVFDAALAVDIAAVIQEGESAPAQESVLIVSDAIADYEAFISAIQDEVSVIKYDADSSLESLSAQIENQLNGQQFSSIGFVADGAPGEFYLLDSLSLNADSLQNDDMSAFWQQISSYLSSEGSIDLLGCNVAFGSEGEALINSLSEIVNEVGSSITVYASSDLSGHASLNADWVLEYPFQSDIQDKYFDSSSIDDWNHTLLGHPPGPIPLDLGSPDGLSEIIADDLTLSDINADVKEVPHASAYNPNKNEFLVVWTEDDPNDDGTKTILKFKRVDASTGAKIENGEILHILPGGEGLANLDYTTNPDLAFDSINNRYLLTFSVNLANGNSNYISGQVLTYNASNNLIVNNPVLGSTLNVGSSSTAEDARVIFDPNSGKFIVVWEGLSTDSREYEVFARLISVDANQAITPLDNPLIISKLADDLHSINPEIAFDSIKNEFIVVWAQGPKSTIFNPDTIFSRRIELAPDQMSVQIADDAQMKALQEVHVSNNPYSFAIADNPDVAFDPITGKALFAWEGQLKGTNENPYDYLIFTRLETPLGDPQSPIGEITSVILPPVVFSDLARNMTPSLFYNPTEANFLLAWKGGNFSRSINPMSDGDRNIFATIIEPNGTPLDNILVSGSSDPLNPPPILDHHQFPNIAFNSQDNKFLVTWFGSTGGQFLGFPEISVSSTSNSVAEGNSGTTNTNTRITLSEALLADVKINYEINNVSAVNSSDFTSSTPGVAIIPAGQLFVDIPHQINGDVTVESNETFIVSLTGSDGPNISSNANQTVTIENDDFPVIPPSAPPSSGDPGGDSPKPPIDITKFDGDLGEGDKEIEEEKPLPEVSAVFDSKTIKGESLNKFVNAIMAELDKIQSLDPNLKLLLAQFPPDEVLVEYGPVQNKDGDFLDESLEDLILLSIETPKGTIDQFLDADSLAALGDLFDDSAPKEDDAMLGDDDDLELSPSKITFKYEGGGEDDAELDALFDELDDLF